MNKILKFKKAAVLILVYTIITVFAIISTSLLSSVINETNLAKRNRLETEVFYLAEGAIEYAISSFASAIANYQIPPDIDCYNTTANFTTFPGNPKVNVTITRLDENDILVVEENAKILTCNYKVKTTAVHPQYPTISVTLNQIINRRRIPTFQHIVFYNDDLEILPGPNMLLSGRMHCNKDIYVDAGVGSTLTIDTFYFRSA
ncbi:MAG: hypothetical protein NC935_08570 [Candidatus Omnitrophica bacterium]|nr:hypothetical protein [Candidatus Omnitrophota bacterium]